VHLRFVPAVLDTLGFDERIFQAPEPGSDLAGTRLGFGQSRRKSEQVPDDTLFPSDGDAASHLGEPRRFGTARPLCPALKKTARPSQKAGRS